VKKVLLSSIIPVGNYERDRENLLQIAENGSRNSVELIFIFDCQGNSSIEFEDELKRLDVKAKVANVLFGNPGSSRNRGLELAEGEFIHFCDSDDYPLYDEILRKISGESADFSAIVGCYETIDAQNGVRKRDIQFNARLFFLNPGLWRWVFRLESLKGLTFPSFSLGEDQNFLVKFLCRNNEITFCSETFYVYRVNQRQSLVARANSTKVEEAISSMLNFLLNEGYFMRPLLIFLMFLRLNVSKIQLSENKVRSLLLSISQAYSLIFKIASLKIKKRLSGIVP
jgi:glycosyltransferase involved in cell wall biosynthesis